MVFHGRTTKDFLTNAIVLVVGLFVLLFLYFDTKNSLRTIQAPRFQEMMRTYESKDMHIKINVSNVFQILEDENSLTLHHQNGDIFIKRRQINAESIDEFMQEMTDENLFSLTKKNRLTINGFSAVKGQMGNEQYYFIYTDNGYVYSFSTSSDLLLESLNEIAQSFHYLP